MPVDIFDNEHIWHPYAPVPNPIKAHKVLSTKGVYLYLDNDKRVIDGMSSWWSAIHGYNHPALNKAIASQLKKMPHVMFGGLTHQAAIDLSKTLVNITPDNLTKVFFSDSGSVSVEVALKMALQYWHQDKPNKKKFIALCGGYHGDTFGAMSVSDPNNNKYHLFTSSTARHFFVKSPAIVTMDEALDDLEKTLKNNADILAAMILEPVVQGAGGMHIYNPQYLSKAKILCEQYQVLLIVDEIATGFGRTGELFALKYANLKPDILCLGKALTGGTMTLAATLTTDKISNQIGTLMHGPTFMANPLACAAGNASINLLFNTPWKDNVARIEKHFYTELSALKNHKKVANVRIIGAIGVIEMINKIDIQKAQIQLINHGVWLRPYGKLLYAMPPFIITDNQLLILTNAMKTIVRV